MRHGDVNLTLNDVTDQCAVSVRPTPEIQIWCVRNLGKKRIKLFAAMNVENLPEVSLDLILSEQ